MSSDGGWQIVRRLDPIEIHSRTFEELETAVARMTDMMVLLQLPNAGDDLQAIKKGIVELADLIVVNKADIDPQQARQAEHALRNGLAILRPASPNWQPPVLGVAATVVLAGMRNPSMRSPSSDSCKGMRI